MRVKTLKKAIASGCRTLAELKAFSELEWLEKDWKPTNVKYYTNKDKK